MRIGRRDRWRARALCASRSPTRPEKLTRKHQVPRRLVLLRLGGRQRCELGEALFAAGGGRDVYETKRPSHRRLRLLRELDRLPWQLLEAFEAHACERAHRGARLERDFAAGAQVHDLGAFDTHAIAHFEERLRYRRHRPRVSPRHSR